MKNSDNQPLNLQQFNRLLQQAKIIDCTYPLTALVWMPNGYKLLQLIENFLNSLFEKHDYERYIFPFLVSSTEFDRINKTISSFEKGLFRVTDSVILRPSGESAIYPMFRQWIKSEKDLPIKAFQIGSMFRQGSTRGFMRPNENDFFVEAHSAFSSRSDAEAEILNSNQLVETYLHWLAIPTLKTLRPPWTNKPVAEKEYAFDTLLPTGETSLINVTYAQMQIFSKAFAISFSRANGTSDHTYQTEFGFSQRSILTSIWLLSQKDRLFLLPSYAPIQIVIIPIDLEDLQLKAYAEKLHALIKTEDMRATIDREEKQLYKRFTKHEQSGVPVRIEIGEKEFLSSSVTIVRQDTKEKFACPFSDVPGRLKQIFESIISDSYQKNKAHLFNSIVLCNKQEEIQEAIKSGTIAKIALCYRESCVKNLQKEIGLGEIIGFEYDTKSAEKNCIHCHETTTNVAFHARRV